MIRPVLKLKFPNRFIEPCCADIARSAAFWYARIYFKRIGNEESY